MLEKEVSRERRCDTVESIRGVRRFPWLRLHISFPRSAQVCPSPVSTWECLCRELGPSFQDATPWPLLDLVLGLCGVPAASPCAPACSGLSSFAMSQLSCSALLSWGQTLWLHKLCSGSLASCCLRCRVVSLCYVLFS